MPNERRGVWGRGRRAVEGRKRARETDFPDDGGRTSANDSASARNQARKGVVGTSSKSAGGRSAEGAAKGRETVKKTIIVVAEVLTESVWRACPRDWAGIKCIIEIFRIWTLICLERSDGPPTNGAAYPVRSSTPHQTSRGVAFRLPLGCSLPLKKAAGCRHLPDL